MWRSNVPKPLPTNFSQGVSQSLANALPPSQQKKKNVTAQTLVLKKTLRIITTISSCDAFYCSAMWKSGLEGNVGFCTAGYVIHVCVCVHKQDGGEG